MHLWAGLSHVAAEWLPPGPHIPASSLATTTEGVSQFPVGPAWPCDCLWDDHSIWLARLWTGAQCQKVGSFFQASRQGVPLLVNPQRKTGGPFPGEGNLDFHYNQHVEHLTWKKDPPFGKCTRAFLKRHTVAWPWCVGIKGWLFHHNLMKSFWLYLNLWENSLVENSWMSGRRD